MFPIKYDDVRGQILLAAVYLHDIAKSLNGLRVLCALHATLRDAQKFYKVLVEGLPRGQLGDKPGKLVFCVAQRGDDIVGAIVVHSLNIADSRAKNHLSFDLVEESGPDGQAGYILLLGVDRDCRREGIASELVFCGIRDTFLLIPELQVVSSDSCGLLCLFAQCVPHTRPRRPLIVCIDPSLRRCSCTPSLTTRDPTRCTKP